MFTAINRYHYNDVIMGAIASQITSLAIVTQPFIQMQIKENIKAPRHWPLCAEFTGDRWIPRTNGQWRGKCFHLMTSSWWNLADHSTSLLSSHMLDSKAIWAFLHKIAGSGLAKFTLVVLNVKYLISSYISLKPLILMCAIWFMCTS